MPGILFLLGTTKQLLWLIPSQGKDRVISITTSQILSGKEKAAFNH